MPDTPEQNSNIFEKDILKKFFGTPAAPQNSPKPLFTNPNLPRIQGAPAEEANPVEEKPKARKTKSKVRKVSKPAVPVEPEIPFVAPEHLFQRKGRVFSVINQKGGCGKTTTAINLTAGLAQQGFEVLLIDIDAQANSTLGYGLRLAPEEKTVYHVFRGSIFTDENRVSMDLIRKTSVPHVSILPSSKFLASLASEILSTKDWEYILRNYLTGIKDSFHYVIIDCPPALNALTVNALTASDEMIIPLQTHYFSLEGMKELFLTIRSVQEKLNPLLKNGLILPTLYDKRARINRDMLESIRNYFKDKVLESIIHMNVKLAESSMHGEPLLTYDPSARGARDYRSLTREVVLKDDLIFNGKPEEILAKFILQ